MGFNGPISSRPRRRPSTAVFEAFINVRWRTSFDKAVSDRLQGTTADANDFVLSSSSRHAVLALTLQALYAYSC